MEFSLLSVRFRNTKDEVLLQRTNNINYCKGLEYLIDSINQSSNIDVEHDVQEVTENYNESNEYEIYTKIETHMSISASLYILNRQGTNILKDFYNKKLSSKDNKDITCPLDKIYLELVHCVNTNRIISDLYTNLISHLDNVLFDECGDLDTFFVKEEEYSLESLYYKQGSWVNELEWNEPHVFEFSKSNDLDEGECMYLLVFFEKYMSLLSKVEEEFNNQRLHDCVVRMRDKMTACHYILKCVLESLVEKDSIHHS